MIAMPRFVFRLQSLLNVKKQLEDSRKNELAKAMRRLEKELEKMRGLENERRGCIEEFNHESQKGGAAGKLKRYASYIAILGERIWEQKENVNRAKNVVDKVREELVKIVQEREILEKLKENKYQAYLEEQARNEQRLNDEIVSYKHGIGIAGDNNG